MWIHNKGKSLTWKPCARPHRNKLLPFFCQNLTIWSLLLPSNLCWIFPSFAPAFHALTARETPWNHSLSVPRYSPRRKPSLRYYYYFCFLNTSKLLVLFVHLEDHYSSASGNLQPAAKVFADNCAKVGIPVDLAALVLLSFPPLVSADLEFSGLQSPPESAALHYYYWSRHPWTIRKLSERPSTHYQHTHTHTWCDLHFHTQLLLDLYSSPFFNNTLQNKPFHHSRYTHKRPNRHHQQFSGVRITFTSIHRITSNFPSNSITPLHTQDVDFAIIAPLEEHWLHEVTFTDTSDRSRIIDRVRPVPFDHISGLYCS